MQDTLILDSANQVIGFCPWTRAVKLYYEGAADVVEEDRSGAVLHSQRIDLPVPRVIRVRNYIARGKKPVALTSRNIAIRDNFECQYCGKYLEDEDQTIDHVLPKSKGGLNTWENLVLACPPCNQYKADFTLDQVGYTLRKKPTKPSAGFQYKLLKVRPEWEDWLVW